MGVVEPQEGEIKMCLPAVCASDLKWRGSIILVVYGHALFLWCRGDYDFLIPLYQKELLKECFPQILMSHRVVQLGDISLGWGSQGQRALIPA